MPDTNGIQLTQAIFRDTTFPTPALVMLTSTADDRREAHEAGIDVYMTKPVRRTRLFNALAEAIGIKIEARAGAGWEQRSRGIISANPDCRGQ